MSGEEMRSRRHQEARFPLLKEQSRQDYTRLNDQASSDDEEALQSWRGAASRRWPTKRLPQRRRLKRSRGSSNLGDELRLSVYCVGENVDCVLLLSRLENGFLRRPPGHWVDVIWENSVHSCLYEDEIHHEPSFHSPKTHTNLRTIDDDLEIGSTLYERTTEHDEHPRSSAPSPRQQRQYEDMPHSIHRRSAEHLAEIKASRRRLEDESCIIEDNSVTSPNKKIDLYEEKDIFQDIDEKEKDQTHHEHRRVQSSANAKHFFVFGFGCLVLWGFEKRDEQFIVSGLLADELAVVSGVTSVAERVEAHDTMAFVIETLHHNRIWCKNDVVRLSSNDPHQKFALSYAIAQSAKLFIWEMRVDDTIKDVKYIPERLASTGRTDLTEKQISQMIGKVFIERTQVNLHSDILDSPDFLWEDDMHEPAYTFFKLHLDVPERVDLLNSRLDVLRDLLEVLNTQLSNQHSSRLEIIVIWLIVAEIFVTIFTFVIDRALPKTFAPAH